MPPSRKQPPPWDQPALPLDVAECPAPPRAPRLRRRSPGAAPSQLTLDALEEAVDGESCETALPARGEAGAQPPAGVSEEIRHLMPAAAAGESDDGPAPDVAEIEFEPPSFERDPFAEIPALGPAPPAAATTGEFVLLPASLRGRLDLREFSRFLAALPTVTRDWEGAPEVEEGGIRLRGADGGAWLYPEARRVRLVTDGNPRGPVAADLVALCRWLEARAGMRLYPEGESSGAGVDRSLDPWEAFG